MDGAVSKSILEKFSASFDLHSTLVSNLIMSQDAEISRLKAQIDELQKDKVALQSENSKLIDSHDSYIRSVRRNELSDEKTIADLTRFIQALQVELDEAKLCIANLKNINSEITEQLTMLQEKGQEKVQNSVEIVRKEDTIIEELRSMSLPRTLSHKQKPGNPNSFFQENLPEHTYMLLIGENGAGKSTLINAFTNYMRFTNIEDAEKYGPAIVIPVNFTTPYTNAFSSTEIVLEPTEPDLYIKKNEIVEIGQSTTQESKMHDFIFHEGKRTKYLHIIDTPGIGDVRGRTQNKINFDNILDYLGIHCKVLHTICIIIKPDATRVNEVFKLFLDQLMTRLHKTATESIIFCFTGTSATDYKPGEAHRELRRYLINMEGRGGRRIELNESTVYSLDNEGFRYLCAKKMGHSFSAVDVKKYTDSYNHSGKEVKRLLSNISLRPYHEVSDTISVNATRQLLLTLMKPIGDITLQQLNSLKEIDEQKAKIKERDQGKKDLSGMSLDAANLQQQFDSATSINKTLLDAKQVEINDGINFMRHCCVEFAVFLKRISIMSFNDKYKEHIEHLIAVEEGKLHESGSRTIVDCLNEQLDQYQKEIICLESDEACTGKPKDSKDMKALVDKLYKSKHYGEQLEELHQAEQNKVGKSVHIRGSNIVLGKT